MDEELKKQLIDEFSEYLDAAPGAADEAEHPRNDVGLYSLFEEFVALKTEVKIEARQFKSALEKFQAALDQLSDQKSHLGELLEQARAGIQKEKNAAIRALLLELLDLRDRIFQGLKAAEDYRIRKFSLCGRRREGRLIEGLREGQALTLKRLDQLLASYDIRPIPAVNQPFDPVSMRAAELDHVPGLENGCVTSELRKGYLWRDEVLRIAEVKVNKVE